ncbi:MAG: SIMPL domain-containing protein, partial [Bacteroidetes bacterium]|nr:SIMPL domain-containing protein [Bacteroidota bacterium]
DLNKLDQLLAAVDPKGIQSTNLESYDYSKMAEVKRELKIQALLAAKEKATYLLNSINEKLGRPIDITETDNSNYPQPRMYSLKAANARYYENIPAPESDINFKTIKLSFQVQVIFEIAP